MIFSQEHIKLIQEGKLTQARRPVKYRRDRSKVPPLRVNQIYSLRSAGASGDGVFTIKTVNEVPLQPIGDLDAKHSGYKTPFDLLQAWAERHGDVQSDDRVWRYTFVYGDQRIDLPRLLTRSQPQHPVCHRCGHGFQRDERICTACGSPRRPESDDDHGYTMRPDLALVGTGEEVSAAEQEAFAEQAEKKPRLSQREIWLEERTEIASALARFETAHEGHLDMDVHNSIRLMRNQIARIDRRLQQAA